MSPQDCRANFLRNTTNLEHYNDIFHEVLGHLTEEGTAKAWMHQESITCHTAQATMHEVSLSFGDQIISKGLWPPHLPDFFLWGYIQDSAHCNNPCNLYELKTSISNTAADNSPLVLQAVSTNILHHAWLWIQHAGASFCSRMYCKQLTLDKDLV
jgi:hypothetical protein